MVYLMTKKLTYADRVKTLKAPGHWAEELFDLRHDPEAQKAHFEKVPESMKAPTRNCYRRELIWHEKRKEESAVRKPLYAFPSSKSL